MKFNQKSLANELIRLNLLVDPSISRASLARRLGKLLKEAREYLADIEDVRERVHFLLELFYGKWGFHCDPKGYFYASNLLLDHVLTSRQGMPASLGSILLFLADGLDLPIYPIDFPSQLVLRVDVEGQHAFINPWDGKYLDYHILQVWLEGARGFGYRLTAEDVEIAEEKALFERLSQVLKTALMREDENMAALQVIKDRLSKEPEDPYEIRDRGMVLANMDCMHVAMEDFDYFIEQCPDDPTAMLLRFELEKMRDNGDFYLIH